MRLDKVENAARPPGRAGWTGIPSDCIAAECGARFRGLRSLRSLHSWLRSAALRTLHLRLGSMQPAQRSRQDRAGAAGAACPPRPLQEIESDLKKIEKEIADMLAEVTE